MAEKIKIAITGHTKGLGKYLHDAFIADGHIVLGFSRSNGYNIKNKEDRERIVAEVNDCNVFINNAFNYEDWDNSQLDMLKDIYYSWINNKDKSIINMSSSASDLYPAPITVPGVPRYPDYIKAKWEQDKWLVTVRNFLNTREQVRLVNLKPGRALTEKTYDKWKDQKVLKTSDVYKIIQIVLKEKDIEFSTVTFKAF
jgi:NAD(P)-dependent dehydrogenase (short-subunit alcohol dehydrogenase family)